MAIRFAYAEIEFLLIEFTARIGDIEQLRQLRPLRVESAQLDLNLTRPQRP